MADKLTFSDWQDLAAKEMKGRDLTWRTPEGIDVKPLYTEAEIAAGGVIPQSDYEFLRKAGVQGIYGPGSNVVECAADMLRLIGHNMSPADEALSEAAE